MYNKYVICNEIKKTLEKVNRSSQKSCWYWPMKSNQTVYQINVHLLVFYNSVKNQLILTIIFGTQNSEKFDRCIQNCPSLPSTSKKLIILPCDTQKVIFNNIHSCMKWDLFFSSTINPSLCLPYELTHEAVATKQLTYVLTMYSVALSAHSQWAEFQQSVMDTANDWWWK